MVVGHCRWLEPGAAGRRGCDVACVLVVGCHMVVSGHGGWLS
jgi:hypothetical protein